MAATKKHAAIQAAKQAERVRICGLQERVKAACNKVPDSVVNGSHQKAVEWKELAHDIFSGASVQHYPAASKSLAGLQQQATGLEIMLARLGVFA